jgi:hypothetical protein
MNMNNTIIVSPHTFGIKSEMDKIFLPLMLSSIKKTNKDARIVFPNPNDFKLSLSGVEEYPLMGLKIDGLSEFKKAYVHLSSNPSQFESACFERFFILRHISKKFGIDNFYTIESDCLLLKPIDDMCKALKLKKSEPVLTDEQCISTAYLTYDFLDKFCEGVLRAYQTSKILEQMTSWFLEYSKSNSGGVCDMTFCSAMKTGWFGQEKIAMHNFSTLYNKEGELHFFDNFFHKNSIFSDPRKFFMDKNLFTENYPIKKYEIVSGEIFTQLDDGSRVQMSSLHFQGNNKKIMGIIYSNLF